MFPSGLMGRSGEAIAKHGEDRGEDGLGLLGGVDEGGSRVFGQGAVTVADFPAVRLALGLHAIGEEGCGARAAQACGSGALGDVEDDGEIGFDACGGHVGDGADVGWVEPARCALVGECGGEESVGKNGVACGEGGRDDPLAELGPAGHVEKHLGAEGHVVLLAVEEDGTDGFAGLGAAGLADLADVDAGVLCGVGDEGELGALAASIGPVEDDEAACERAEPGVVHGASLEARGRCALGARWRRAATDCMPYLAGVPDPTATIVIPCFNHGRFVGDAVRSCLAQARASVEVVVVNDGSDDGTTPAACDAVACERVRVIHQANLGLPAARNRGAAVARGEYIAFLDADDWIEPGFVGALAAAIEGEVRAGRGEDVFHAYCQERLVELGEGVWRVPAWDGELMLITNLHPVTALIRRERFEALGGFDATMTRGYEDWELWVRAVGRGWRGVRVAEPLFVWRRHSPTTMIHDAVGRHAELVGAIIDRNRATYERRFEALFRRANEMLRRFDCNWLDESGDPIPLRHLREAHAALGPALARLSALEAEHAAAGAAAQAEVGRLRDEVSAWSGAAAGARAELEAQREAYERMIAVRVHHRVFAVARAMPGPVRAVLRAPRALLRRLAGRPPERRS